VTKPIPVMNLGQLLAHTARQFPNLPAVIKGDKQWSWHEVNARVNAMVLAFRKLGVKKGDRILIQSRNNLQLFESCWVAFRLGCVWVPTNFRMTPPEVVYLARSSGTKVMIAELEFLSHLQAVQADSPTLSVSVVIGQSDGQYLSYESMVLEHIESTEVAEAETVSYDDPLWFFYTSGTTGRPKAGVLTHGQMAFVVTNHLADLIPGTNELDCSIVVAPLSHGAGIHALLNVARGAPSVLLPTDKFEPEVFWQLVEKHRVSNLFTVPTIVKMLVEDKSVDKYDHSSLRYVIYAGAPMYRSDQKLALQKLGKVLVQYFGLGEVTGCITVLPPQMHSEVDDDPNANIGSCGRPRTGMEIAILDSQSNHLAVGEVGEICCRGLGVFSGYFDNPTATREVFRNGWFHTGDLGRLDERGFLYITGRESDMYISGGSNVYPREVEEVLLSHPSISEVAVLGVPDPKWGEIGIAVIVPKKGADSISTDDVLKHLDGKCASYRWPKHIFFWDQLPKSGYGKITKNEVRRLLVERKQIEATVV
jgi:fatty-acyl-CoA synthase